jgi:hypothetical protein
MYIILTSGDRITPPSGAGRREITLLPENYGNILNI